MLRKRGTRPGVSVRVRSGPVRKVPASRTRTVAAGGVRRDGDGGRMGGTVFAFGETVGDGEAGCSAANDNIVVGGEEVGGISDVQVACRDCGCQVGDEEGLRVHGE